MATVSVFHQLLLLLLAAHCCFVAGAADVAPRDSSRQSVLPMVINTWPFTHATAEAWEALLQTGSPIEAVVAGCSVCEEEQCDLSVGFGGSPDESGETTLDAMVMDGATLDVGAVGALRGVKSAIRVAQFVLERTQHTLLVGDQAVDFALSMGVPGPENLTTNESETLWETWRAGGCQPNFRRNVLPDSTTSCGPYHVATAGKATGIHTNETLQHTKGWRQLATKGGPDVTAGSSRGHLGVSRKNHDTITMVAIAEDGRMASGGSTNGLTFKVPGRVGDTPIPGAGTYVDAEVGGCGATGDGDIMMRFLPCYQAVESLRQGLTPQQAADDAIGRIRRKAPDFVGALFVVTNRGEHAGATANWVFEYAVRSANSKDIQIFQVLDPLAKSTVFA